MEGRKHMTDASGRSGSSMMDASTDRGKGTAMRNKPMRNKPMKKKMAMKRGKKMMDDYT